MPASLHPCFTAVDQKEEDTQAIMTHNRQLCHRSITAAQLPGSVHARPLAGSSDSCSNNPALAQLETSKQLPTVLLQALVYALVIGAGGWELIRLSYKNFHLNPLNALPKGLSM